LVYPLRFFGAFDFVFFCIDGCRGTTLSFLVFSFFDPEKKSFTYFSFPLGIDLILRGVGSFSGLNLFFCRFLFTLLSLGA